MKDMSFELILFFTTEAFCAEAYAAGIHGFLIDWESMGKQARQNGYDTQINAHTPDDLRRLRGAVAGNIICRVNRCGPHTRREIETAIGGGANEILLPMVTTLGEIETTLRLIDGRCGLGVMIETLGAVRIAAEINRLPLTRVYVGLNDLGIERQTPHIFSALEDGTLEAIRNALPDLPFGFAGLTLPDSGYPLPCIMLINEMARLGASFSVLRRSFLRDIQGRAMSAEIPRLRAALEAARQRTPEQIEADRRALLDAVNLLPVGPWPI